MAYGTLVGIFEKMITDMFLQLLVVLEHFQTDFARLVHSVVRVLNMVQNFGVTVVGTGAYPTRVVPVHQFTMGLLHVRYKRRRVFQYLQQINTKLSSENIGTFL